MPTARFPMPLVAITSPPLVAFACVTSAAAVSFADPQSVPEPHPPRTDGVRVESPSLAPDLSIDRTRLYFSEQNEVTWVRGATYKARLAPTGLRYIPFFGSDAPCNYPIDVTLIAATLGAEVLPLEQAGHVARHGNHFLLDRGPVDVVVEFGVKEIEQSFIVEAAGESRDLRLVLNVETDLACAPMNGGLRFANALGSVHCSEAFVLDGAGRREAISTEINGHELTLTVPAAFLSVAQGEIVIDPVFSTYSVSNLPGAQRDVDLSFDLTTNEFLYVFEDQFSGSDIDVLATAVDADTGASAATEYFDASDETWVDPSVGNANASDTSLCAAAVLDPNFGQPRNISFRLWDHHLRGFGPLVFVGTNSDAGNPDVGGSSSEMSGGAFCIAWSGNLPSAPIVFYRVFSVDGFIVGQGELNLSNVWPSGTVSISESSGDSATVDQWQIAWPERGFGFPGPRLRVAAVRRDGTLVHPATTLKEFTPPDVIRDVHVSDAVQIGTFADPTYAVVYDLDSSGDEDTIVALGRGTTLLREVELQRSEHAGFRPDQSEARIATTRDRFVVAYLEGLPSTGYRALVTSFEVIEDSLLAVAERRTELGTVTPPGWPFHDGGALSMASKYSTGLLASTQVGIGIDRATAGPPDVDAVVFDDTSPSSPAYQYCYGNRNSTGSRGFIRMEGDNSVATTKALRASGLPPGSFGYFVVGDGFANVMNPAGSAGVLCVGGTVGRYVQLIQAADAAGEISVTFDPAAIPQPTGTVAGTAGDVWQFTLWHRDASPSGVPTSNFTNAVSILLQ